MNIYKYFFLGIPPDDAELDESLIKISIHFNTFLNELFFNELNRNEVTKIREIKNGKQQYICCMSRLVQKNLQVYLFN